ncbi:MAG: TlyA family RNA methyltransferase [Fusobacteriota bacterium]
MKDRLDKVLVERDFFESRSRAKRAIMAGLVIVNEHKEDKAGTQIDFDSNIRIKGDRLKYVGRGGLKLEKAVKVFNIDFKDKYVLDVGASTGGFTDCALQNGAKQVYSVDVGTNQLSWKMRKNSKVKSLEQMHIKDLKLKDIDNNQVDYIVMDVSFISITRIFKDLIKFLKDNGKLMALIKPQFEVGKDNVGKGGIIRDFSKHKMAIKNVINEAKNSGFYLEDLEVSPITGGKGNVEYISLFSFDKSQKIETENLIKRVINKGKAKKNENKK